MKIYESCNHLEGGPHIHALYKNIARKRKWEQAYKKSKNYEEKCTADPIHGNGNMLLCLLIPPILIVLTVASFLLIPATIIASLNYRYFKNWRIERGAKKRFKKMRMPK